MIQSATPTKETNNNDDPNPELRSFYDNLKEKGVAPNLPEYETFTSTLQDSLARRKFYDNLSQKDGISLPEYETFQNTLFSGASKSKESGENTLKSSSSDSPQRADLQPPDSTALPQNEGYENYPADRENPDPVARKREGGEKDDDGKDKSFSQIAKTFWNVATKQIPSAMKGGLSATLNRNMAISPGGYPHAGRGVQEQSEEIMSDIPEERKNLLTGALSGMEDFQQSQKDAVTTTEDIGDGIDAINYIGNAIAQSAAQIPLALATGGLSSMGQEIGIVYMDQVEKIAEKEGIEPEQVIEQGLDDPASATAYGIMAGALDYAGAKGATKAIPYQDFKQSLGQRAIGMFSAAKTEGLTESGQSALEQFGSSRGAGDSFLESLTGINPQEAAEEGLVGFIGGGGVQAGTQAIESAANQVKQKARETDKGLPEGWVIKEMQEDGPTETAGQEQQVQEQQIDQGVEFDIDPEAAPEQQIEQLTQERERLEARKALEGMEGNTTEDIDNALAQIEEMEAGLQYQMEQELDADPEVSEEQEVEQAEPEQQEVSDELSSIRDEIEHFESLDDLSDADTEYLEYLRGQEQDLQGQQAEPVVQESEEFTDREQAEEVNAIDFSYDESAPLPDQISQLREEKERLMDLFETGSQPANNSIEQIDTLLDEKVGQADEQITQETPDVSPVEIPAMDGRYNVKRDQDGITVTNQDTGNEVGRRSNNFNSVVAEALVSDTENNTETVSDENIENEQDWIQEVANNSTNPIEIADAFQLSKELRNVRRESESGEVLQQFFDEGGRVRPEEFAEYSDPQLFQDDRNLRFLTSKDATPLDVQAQELSTASGRDITPDMIMEFLVDDYIDQRESGQTDNLRKRFKDITGVNLTDKLAQEIENQQLNSFTDEESNVLQEAIMLSDDYINDRGEVDYQSLWEQELQDDSGKEFFTGFPGDLTEEQYQELKTEVQNEIGRDDTGQAQEATGPERTDEAGQDQGQQEGVWHDPTEEQYRQAQERLDEIAREQGDQLNTGLDPSQINPEAFKHYVTIGAYHIRKGARDFADFSQRMVQELGERVRPHLQSIYNELRQSDQFNSEEFTDPAEVQQLAEEGIGTPQEGQSQLSEQASDSPVYQSFVEDAGESINQIGNPDLNISVPAAEQAVEAALDNGVTSQLEFRKWAEDVLQDDPNYRALQDGWENALSNPRNEDKLAYNNQEGSVWDSVRKWVNDTRYGITKRFFVYNQRARDIENKMDDIFGPEYFEGENAKFIMSWAMDRVPGQAGNMIDKFIHTGKRYSLLNKIIRDIGIHPEINTTDFNEINNLYQDLAQANNENRPEKARRIEEQIREITQEDDLHTYMLAMHARESNDYAQNTKNTEEIAEVEDKIQDLKTKRKDTHNYTKRKELQEEIEAQQEYLQTLKHPLNITTQEANEILSGFEERGIQQDLRHIAEKVWAMNDAYLSMAVDNGIISQKEAKNMRDTYSHYVPAQRKLTDDQGNLVGDVLPTKRTDGNTPQVRERKGSTKVIGHTLANTVSNMQDMIHYSFRNKSYSDIAASVEREQSHGNTSWGRVVDAEQVPDNTRNEITEFSRPEMRTTYDEDGNQVEEETIVDKAIIWDDAELGKAVNQTDMIGTNGIPEGVTNALRFVINWERAVLTSVNPSFLFVNPVRDVQDAAFNLSNRESFKSAVNLLKNDLLPKFESQDGDQAPWTDRIFGAHRAIVAYEKGNHNKNELTEAFGELKSLGGTSSFFRFRSTEDIVSRLNGKIEDIKALESDPITSPKKYKALIENKMEALEVLNEAMENATRLAVFKTIRDQGKSKEEAARLAKEATVNFDMQGTYSGYFKLAYMFFQVALNAVTSNLKGYVTNPKSYMVGATALTMAGMGVAALMDEMSPEDDYYKDKESNLWKYESNLVFKIPGLDNLPLMGNDQLTIPVGYMLSTFTGFGGHLYDYLKGYSTAEELYQRSASAAADVYNPFGGSEMFTDSKYFARSVAPTWSQPVADIWANRSFFGPIFNEFLDSNPDYPDYLLRSPGDRRMSKYLSTWLAKHDIADISPKTFDHFVDFIGGGTLRDIESSGGKIIGAFEAAANNWENADGTPYEVKARELPVLRRFIDEASSTKIAYNHLWTTVNSDKGPISPQTPEFHNHIKGIAEDYRKVVNSDMIPDHMTESLDSAIKQYIQQNNRQHTLQETVKYFRRIGSTGSEGKSDRQAYYRAQNQLDQSYWTWENGQFKYKTSARRKAFTNTMIKKIETKVGSITDVDE